MKLFQFLSMGLVIVVSGTTMQAQQKGHQPNKVQDSIFETYRTPQKSTTTGSVTVEGKAINYKAIAGTLVLRDSDEKPTISMSYTAYFKDGEKDATKRPLTFIYNGGPGSATLWLHMGAWGPQKVFIRDTTRTRAPYKTVNNDYSLLDASDLVFIDAPGTGFGHIITNDMGGAGKNSDFYGIDQDGQAFANFIEDFITTYHRWNSPKYLFGESYGTFRSALVANILQRQKNIGLNGVILLSQLLTYENMTEAADGHPGDDRSYMLVLPSFAATAWYHHKIPNQPTELRPFLKEVEDFALTDYASALNQGALLSKDKFNEIAQKLHNYTGLPLAYIKKANLRVTGPQFEQTLLGDDNEITGRLDSRFKGAAANPLSENAEYDPMDSYIDAAFTSTFNNYTRTQLKFGDGMKYKVFGNVHPWEMKRRGWIGFPNVMNDLAQAMIYNPDLKVMLNGGLFDLGTPYYEGIYEMHHLPMPEDLQKNIEYYQYMSGHMVYLHEDSLKLLHDNVAKFINDTHS
ncbi:S10 family peptidase [Zhouia sp. PK063]|uniref:S10 family peptidase n=1 Tax=Zhouia sp. PK063 TaxID=3373602 RepID=UPI00378872EC